MNANDIRKLITAQPFEPFEIVLVDGRKFLIDHPDYIFAPPMPRATWVLVVDDDGAGEHINTLVISSVRIHRNSRDRARRRRKAG